MARPADIPTTFDRVEAAVSLYLTLVLAAVIVAVAIGRPYAKELPGWRLGLAVGAPMVAGWLLARGHLGGWLVDKWLGWMRRGRP